MYEYIKENSNNKPGRLINIALLISDFKSEYDGKIWSAIKKAADYYNVNLICLEGGELGVQTHSKRNEIFNLINSEKLSGIILISPSIGNFLGKSELQKIVNIHKKIPIVSIGMRLDGVSSLLIDNESGMKTLLDHFYKVHNYKKILFIRGPENNTEAEIRYRTYLDFLKKNNIPFDDRIVIQANFLVEFEFNNFQKIIKNINIDSVIACNDILAVKAINELKRMNIKVPEDIGVAGFDNSDLANEFLLSLTTVRQPVFDLGYNSLKLLLSIIDGKETNEKVIVLPTKLIIRSSCGCTKHNALSSINIKNKYSNNIEIIEKLERSNTNIILRILNDAEDQIDNFYCYKIQKKDIQKILNLFILNLKDLTKNYFLFHIETIINPDNNKYDILMWGKLINIFFENIEPYFLDKNSIEFINGVWRKTNKIFENLYHKMIRNKSFKFQIKIFELYLASDNLTSALNKKNIKRLVLMRFPQLGIRSCYIFLYKDKKKEKSELFLGYTLIKNKMISEEKKIFNSIDIIPDLFNKNNNYKSWIVSALFFKDKNIGFVIYEANTDNVLLFNTLTYQLSGAIRSSELMEEVQKYSKTLEKKVQDRTCNLEDAKKEIEEANEELKKLDALKNDFIENITHDFRSPLTAILNISDLGKRISTENNITESFEIIHDASLKLNNSINHLLNLAKMDAQGIELKIEKIDIFKFINRILDFYSTTVNNTGIKFKKVFPDSKEVFIFTDSEKLEQVIDNILSNAIKFVNPENGIISFSLIENQKSIVLCFKDNGIGIPRDKIHKIFNRFEQVHDNKNAYGGTGIGLAFSKQLIEYLKGKVWAESEGEGCGAGFFIELKKDKNIFNNEDFSERIIRGNEILKKKEIELMIKSNLKKYHNKEELIADINELNNKNEYDYKKAIILIVDDDDIVRKIIYNYLKVNGYQNFLFAPNGKIGLKAVYEYSPNIIISDYNMPELSGDEFHNAVISNPEYNKIPFVFLSAVSDSVIIQERKTKGADAYLMKPINEKELLVTIELLLKNR